MATSTPNLVKISEVAAELWRFSFFQNGGHRHLGLAQPTYKTTHDGALAVLSVLSNFVLIWLTVLKILKIQFFLRLAWNRLTMPTFWGLYGVLIPWTIFFSSKPPKGTSLGEAASFEVQIMKIRPPIFAAGDDKKKRKGKERKGKVSHNLGLYGEQTPLDRLLRKLAGGRGPWHNHSVQFWFQYFQGFQIYRGSKFPSSHWLCWLSLQQCCWYHAACDIIIISHHNVKLVCSTARHSQWILQS